MSDDEARFIGNLFKDLYYELLKEEQAKPNNSGKQRDKIQLIKDYFNNQDNIHKYMSETSRKKEILKVFYHKKYIVDDNNIPRDYIKRVMMIRSDIRLSEDAIAKSIIQSQKDSLDTWIDFLLDSNEFPFWVKYWAFQSMLQIGRYDIKSGNYSRRTETTLRPFIELNKDALLEAMKLIMRSQKKENINDKELETIVNNGSFARIYIKLLSKYMTVKSNDGIWKKYEQGSDSSELVSMLSGNGTGWCISYDSVFIKDYIKMGDFYIYFTKDKNGNYTVPRIAIRTIGQETLKEIRGIASGEHMEQDLEEVVSEKLEEFKKYKNYDKFCRIVSDMRKLSNLYRRFKENEVLSIDDLKFLYEVNYKINDFGAISCDPRIIEIKSNRNQLEDFVKMVDSGLVINGSVSISCPKKIDKLDLSKVVINGSLKFDNVEEVDEIIFPKTAYDISLPNLKCAKGIVFPENVHNLDLSGLTSTEGLVLSRNVSGLVDLSGLSSAKGLVIPENISIDLSGLKNARDLIVPKNTGSFFLNDLMDTRDLNLSGVTINGDLGLCGIWDPEDFKLSGVTINGNVLLRNLESMVGLDTSNIIINGVIYLKNDKTVDLKSSSTNRR